MTWDFVLKLAVLMVLGTFLASFIVSQVTTALNKEEKL